MRLSPLLVVLLLGGCHWVAGYDRAVSEEGSETSPREDAHHFPDGAHFDGVAEGGRRDGGVDAFASDATVDGPRLDTAPRDVSAESLAPDTSADTLTPDASVDSSSPDGSVDTLAPDTSADTLAPDTSVDTLAPDTSVDTTSDTGIPWKVYPIEANTAGTLTVRSVAIDNRGNLAVGGSFTGSVTLPGLPGGALCKMQRCPLVMVGSPAGSGDYTFERRSFSATNGQVEDVTFDGNGRLLAAGSFSGNLILLSPALSANVFPVGGVDGFVLRWDASGGLDWARQIKGDGDDEVLAVTSHPSDPEVYAVGGRFTSTAVVSEDLSDRSEDIAPKPAADAASTDGFVMVFTGDATVADVVPAGQVIGGSGEDAIYDVLLTQPASETELLAAGAYGGTLVNGCSGVSPSLGQQDGLVARWYAHGNGLLPGGCVTYGNVNQDEARRVVDTGLGGASFVMGTVQEYGDFGGYAYGSSSVDSDFFQGTMISGSVSAARASEHRGPERLLGAATFSYEPIFAGTLDSAGILIQGLDYSRVLARFDAPSVNASMDVASDDTIIVLASDSEAYGELPGGEVGGPYQVAFIAIARP